MSNPTQAEIETQLRNATALLEAIRIRGSVTATNNVGARVDTLTQSLKGVYADQTLRAAGAIRRNYATAITPEQVRAILAPVLLEEGRRIGSPTLSADQLLRDQPGSIFRHFVENGRWLKSRALSLGTITAGAGNTGDGELLRVAVDRYGSPLEGAYSPKDTPVTAICTRDSVTGNAIPGEEVFRIYGRSRGVDAIDERGSGADVTVPAKSSKQSEGVLNNPSFSQVTPTTNDATVTTLPGWDVTTSIGSLRTVDSDTYRPLGNEATPRALRMTVDETITTANNLRSIDVNRPYVVQIAYKREASCDGTLTLTVGAVSTAVTLSAQTGWSVLRIALDADAWPPNWQGSTLKISVALSSRTMGTLLIDDVVVQPMDAADGLFYAPVGGATKFLVDDSFSSADSETGAINQRWISRGWPGLYLPATSDATQITASGGRTLTFATSVNTITASSGSFLTDGYKVGMLLTVGGTSDNNGTYTIATVTATVITVAESLANEGPLSSTATLDATASILDPVVS